MANGFVQGRNPLLKASEFALQSSENQKSRLEAQAYGAMLGREEAKTKREDAEKS